MQVPLSALPGISYAREVRLHREGLDSIEDLSRASAIDLSLRTGFCYGQLSQWIGEAWLRVHLGAQDFNGNPRFRQDSCGFRHVDGTQMGNPG